MKKILSTLATLFVALAALGAGHTVSITATMTTCGSSCDGVLSATVSGGIGPFSYSWSPGGGTNMTASGLCAGSYTVTVTDSSDMSTATATATVTSPPMLVNTASGGMTCAGGCIVLNSASSGGTPPYAYMWTPATDLSSTYVPNPMACPVSTGTYTLITTDGNGCTAYAVATVAVDAPMTITTSPVATPCGACTGSITATVSGGTAPYTYSWSGPSGYTSTTANPTALCGGTYTVNITDASGCAQSGGGTVTNTGAPVVVTDSIAQINCAGSVAGAITVHATGGSGTYTYSWSSGQTTPAITGLTAGFYSVTVSDGSGCNGYASYNISNGSSLYPVITTVPPNCSSLGSATVAPYGGTPPYYFLWNDSIGQTTATALALAAGSYMVTITDSIGCVATGSVSLILNCLNVVKGRVYNDANLNCVQDAGEPGVPWLPVHSATGGGYAYTNALGDYSLFTTALNPNIIVSTSGMTALAPTCPSTGSQVINFAAMGDTISNVDFGYHVDSSLFDLVIHPGWSSANPGFQKTYWICYYNNSYTPQNAVVNFVYDTALQFVSATMGGVHNAATHTISWNFPALAPASLWDWATRPIITFNVPASLPLTYSLNSHFEILPIATDADPSDNSYDYSEPVTGSHDPNSKAVIPAGVGPGGDITAADSVLTYTIHFQNNGNDTAYTVIVKDTLSQFLDPLTIVPGASSHPYTFNLAYNGELTFRFDSIMLPDSIHDLQGSNGYFNYSVKVRAGTPVGSVINNTASIYFDFNEAVVTNTTVNTIVLPAGIAEERNSNNAVVVYPNPFDDYATFRFAEEPHQSCSFELSDVLGRNVRTISRITGQSFTISKAELPAGVYFYKIISEGFIKYSGKLVIR